MHGFLVQGLILILSNFECQVEVLATVCWVEFGEIERMRRESVNQSAESHSISPGRAEVGDVDVLKEIP